MRSQRGITLAELLIVIVILALLAGIGVPAMRDLVLNNRQVGMLNELVSAIQLARSEAITRNVNIPSTMSVCPSDSGTGCGGTWADGWVVFVDVDGAGDFDAGVDTVVRAFEGGKNLTVTATGIGNAVRYRRDGRATDAGDFVVCDPRGSAQARVVQLGISGRPSVSKYLSDGSSPSCD